MMKRHSKKILAMLLSAMMLAAAASSCGQEKEPGSAPASSSSAASQTEETDSGLTPVGELPISKDGLTLTAFAQNNGSNNDWSYGNNDFTTWLVDQTGIQLDITLAASADAKEKLSLLITAGEYPEVLFRSGLSLSEQQIYGAQGMLLPLNDLIEKYASNAQAMFEAYPLAKTAFTLGDGNMYDLPSVNECYHCSKTQKMWIYSPWFEQLGVDAPQTTEEFYEYLKLVKATDLNGNGKADEIPLAGSPKGWDTNMEGFLMQPFSYTETYVDNGAVKMPYAEDGWKEGLRYLHRLYEEGLMAPESLIQDDSQFQQMGSMPEHILACAPGGYQGSVAPGSDYELWTTLAPLEGPTGRQTRYTPYDDYYSSFSITDKCKNPEAAVRLADFMLTEEATLRNCNSVKDVNWRYVTEDLPSIDGGKAIWETIGADADRPPEACWNQVGPTLRTSALRLGIPTTENSYMEVALYEESLNKYAPYLQPDDSIFPRSALAYSEEQAAEIATVQAPFDEYVKEMTAKFISGEKSIDADWDSYVANLEKMGMSTLLSLYQQAYSEKFQ